MKGLVGGLVAGLVSTSAGRSFMVGAQDGSGEQGDEGDPCSEVLTCGPGLMCSAGFCAIADGSGEQGDEGDPCSDVLTCGPGLVCQQGTCQVLSLPATGAGTTFSEPEHVTESLIAATAVAGAGAWMLRRAHDTSRAASVTAANHDGQD